MKSPGKYVDRSLEDLIQHQQSGWLTGKINSKLPCFILCTGRLRRCWWFYVYNHQQIISANCFWWIAHHLWDVSWQHSPFSGAPLLAQHFKHRAKTHVVKRIWPKGRTFWHRAEIHDVSPAAWDWCILQNREDFSTVTRFTNHRTLLGKNYCCHLTTYMCKDHCFSHSYIKESPLISYHGVLVSCKMITPPLLSVLKVHWTVWLI